MDFRILIGADIRQYEQPVIVTGGIAQGALTPANRTPEAPALPAPKREKQRAAHSA